MAAENIDGPPMAVLHARAMGPGEIGLFSSQAGSDPIFIEVRQNGWQNAKFANHFIFSPSGLIVGCGSLLILVCLTEFVALKAWYAKCAIRSVRREKRQVVVVTNDRRQASFNLALEPQTHSTRELFSAPEETDGLIMVLPRDPEGKPM